MSVFYDLASLVLVPSGYKASKVYAQKPLTADGQLTFSRASTATRVNASGVIEAVASNVPRLDYLGSTCPKLLLEPQRANLFLYSNDFSDSNWAKSGTSITASAIISPDGTVNAWKLNDTTANAQHALLRSVGGVTSPSAISFFVESAEYSKCCIENYSDGGRVIFDIANKTIVSTSANFTGGTIQQYANGFIRISATTVGTTGNKAFGLGLVNDLGQDSFVGTGTKGIYVYGAQIEAGAYATSYIPTTTAAVTRLADAASKTGISSLIGQTEGTIFAEINFDLGVTAQGDSRIQLSDGTASNWIFIGLPDGASGNLVRMYVNTPSSAMTAYSSNPVVNGVNKIAFGYKSGSFVLYVNGVQAATSSTTLTMAACSRIDLQGSVPAASAQERTNYKQLLLFKTRLTNAQLAEITQL
jgi:hypothetical protein